MIRAQRTPFDGHYSPAAVRWWFETMPGYRGEGTTYSHLGVLREMLGGRSSEETEMLSWCFSRTVGEGARSASGRWCVCLTENPPSAGEWRSGAKGDGMSALVSVVADLDRAADALPISWTSTQGIFETQGRGGVYRARLVYYRNNLRVREIDRWLEPRDETSGRPRSRMLAYWLMARELGGARDTCAWPKPLSLVERDVISARVRELQEAA